MSTEILIIDDNPDIRNILNDLISEAGYETRLAANYNQALSEIDKKLPDVAIIDVREPDEYNQAHIKNAILIPVDEIMTRVDELPSDKKLLFVCASGYRSGLACEMAAAMGVDTSKIFNIDGGTQGWIENGHPTNSGPNP